jgi:hypothetical protein
MRPCSMLPHRCTTSHQPPATSHQPPASRPPAGHPSRCPLPPHPPTHPLRSAAMHLTSQPEHAAAWHMCHPYTCASSYLSPHPPPHPLRPQSQPHPQPQPPAGTYPKRRFTASRRCARWTRPWSSPWRCSGSLTSSPAGPTWSPRACCSRRPRSTRWWCTRPYGCPGHSSRQVRGTDACGAAVQTCLPMQVCVIPSMPYCSVKMQYSVCHHATIQL